MGLSISARNIDAAALLPVDVRNRFKYDVLVARG